MDAFEKKNSMEQGVLFKLNGHPVEVKACPGARLSFILREDLGARDVKVGCNAGDCGACTVLVNGLAVCACTTALAQVAQTHVETLTGLMSSDPHARVLADLFLLHDAAQCGICTPGMMVTALAWLRRDPPAQERQEKGVADALGGVLCRCTGYRKILAAVLDAAQGKNSLDILEAKEKSIPLRLDGEAKISGAERFGDDVAPPDALWLRVVRSPHAHATFSFGDLEDYRQRHLGLKLILTAADISPENNRFGVIDGFEDQPVFADKLVRFRGEAVAAVVGTRAPLLDLDLEDFPVTWQPQSALISIAQATCLGAPQLHKERNGNILCSGLVTRGDNEAGCARAAHIAQGSFHTAFVEHAYIEPEAGYAQVVEDVLEVYACTQAPFMDRSSLAQILDLPKERIRIIPTAVGGGFGSKLDLSLQPYIALAAWKLKCPVRMTYSRRESMQATTKRHPGTITLKIAAAEDGRILSFDETAVFNTGAYASWGPTVATRVPVHASGPYYIENYRCHSQAVLTHGPPSGAFRGFGVPQAAIAQESLFDDLAKAVGMDRLEFRHLNALRAGQPTVTGQIFTQGVGIAACFEALRTHWRQANVEAASDNKEQRRKGSPRRYGVGVAGGWYGCGNTSLPNPSTIKAGLRADGKVVLHQGAVDIGQGSNTVITQLFAKALGIKPQQVVRIDADTACTPDAGKTSASRQTFVTGNAARLSGQALRHQILRLGNVSTQAQIELGQGVVHLKEGAAVQSIDLARLCEDGDGFVLRAAESYNPITQPLDAQGQGRPYALFGYAAQMASLEVDLDLGLVRLIKITAAHDVGYAVNPSLIRGQIHGGIAQGIGMALMEEFIAGCTENLHDYLIPTLGDVPPIEVIIIEEPDPEGPYGAKGLGEHALVPTAPAILNAIKDASGARIHQLPATPDRVYAALTERESTRR